MRTSPIRVEIILQRVGRTASGTSVVELTTTGGRSCKPRLTMLKSLHQEDSSFVGVASLGANDRHLDTYLNLVEQPTAVGAVDEIIPLSMYGEIVEANERIRLRTLLTARQPRYGE